ncbi:DUF4239 domain-containing protein [Nordella sp. HKS 07]|uniref:bestrophin-like domain n=1 Tax=Nordella sp. HKS 07 TaxID=2712222 RepID=UPI0013E13D44|nr:DUF4239 domain-containing protein [Nordella sp. HKS 07]QIG46841.1 DUF4239 domain-containing protein [Nordella sp. HKS 07]
MTWLYFLSFPLLLPVLTLMTGLVSALLWWLPKLPYLAPLMRWGKGMSPVIQGICGTLFVLATTFLSSSVWTAEDKAYEAVAVEARQVRQLRTLAHLFPEPRRSELVVLVHEYAEQSAAEWPHMTETGGSRAAEEVLNALYGAAVSLAGSEQMLSDQIIQALNAVGEARERRLDIARNSVNQDQWVVMLILALILGVAVTFVHIDDDRARAIALALVTVMVATALLLMIMHDRPFIGYEALGPEAILAAAKGL